MKINFKTFDQKFTIVSLFSCIGSITDMKTSKRSILGKSKLLTCIEQYNSVGPLTRSCATCYMLVCACARLKTKSCGIVLMNVCLDHEPRSTPQMVMSLVWVFHVQTSPWIECLLLSVQRETLFSKQGGMNWLVKLCQPSVHFYGTENYVFLTAFFSQRM